MFALDFVTQGQVVTALGDIFMAGKKILVVASRRSIETRHFRRDVSELD